MAGLIQLDSVEYISATTLASVAADNLNVNLDTWSSLGESSIALEAFAQQYVEMEKTMKLFQTLLQQDVKSMADIGQELLLADLKLATLWKKAR